MSKAQEKLIVELSRIDAEIAFRKAALSLGTIRELEEGHFSIKETDNGYSAGTLTMGQFGAAFSTDKTTNPATVDIYIKSITSSQTEILIMASCFGGGPIQNNHCKAKLSTVKSAIMVAISEMAKPMSQQVLTVEKRNEEGEKQETISQPSSDKAIITVEKTEENVEKKFDIYRNLMFVFMVATLSFYVFVNAFWYHIVCNVLIFVTSTISFTFSVLYLKKEKDWFVQIVAPVMFLLMIISLKSF